MLWAFQRLSLAGQLDYITTGCRTLSTGFLIFSTNFGRNFWAVCILWWVGVLAQVVGEGCGNGREKPSPLGGRWRGTRRMRGICPVVAPSSVTCGDSFPQRGSHTGGLPGIFVITYGRGRGMPRPYGVVNFVCCGNRKTARRGQYPSLRIGG